MKVKSNGQVTAKIWFEIGALCEVDYGKFPEDTMKCGFNLLSEEYKENFNIIVNRDKQNINKEIYHQIWDIKLIDTTVLQTKATRGREEKGQTHS